MGKAVSKAVRWVGKVAVKAVEWVGNVVSKAADFVVHAGVLAWNVIVNKQNPFASRFHEKVQRTNIDEIHIVNKEWKTTCGCTSNCRTPGHHKSDTKFYKNGQEISLSDLEEKLRQEYWEARLEVVDLQSKVNLQKQNLDRLHQDLSRKEVQRRGLERDISDLKEENGSLRADIWSKDQHLLSLRQSNAMTSSRIRVLDESNRVQQNRIKELKSANSLLNQTISILKAEIKDLKRETAYYQQLEKDVNLLNEHKKEEIDRQMGRNQNLKDYFAMNVDTSLNLDNLLFHANQIAAMQDITNTFSIPTNLKEIRIDGKYSMQADRFH